MIYEYEKTDRDALPKLKYGFLRVFYRYPYSGNWDLCVIDRPWNKETNIIDFVRECIPEDANIAGAAYLPHDSQSSVFYDTVFEQFNLEKAEWKKAKVSQN